MTTTTETPTTTTNGNGTGSEAPSSATVKFLLEGFEFLFTVRDASAHQLLSKRIPAIAKAIAEAGGTPAPSWSKKGESKDNGERKVCPIHATELRRFEKNGKTWYSHKAIDPETETEFWCYGGAK